MKSIAQTVNHIALQLIMVFVTVKSECFEEDCSGQAIRVVNPSSRECVTCYPCLQCPVGQTPSVSCPSTVPQGTHIHCVLIVPGPSSVSVSRASAYTTNPIFNLLASPSVTPWYSFPTGTRQLTTATSSSSKDYTDSSSLIVTVPNTREIRELLNPEYDSKMADDHKALYLSCGMTLLFVFLAICYRLRKSITPLFQRIIGNHPMTIAPSYSMAGTPLSHVDNRDPFAVHLYPENNSVLFLPSALKEDSHENVGQENNNQLFHYNQTMLPADKSIPSLDDSHAEDHQQSAINEGASGSDVARSIKGPSSEILPDQPSMLTSIKDSKSPITVLTPSMKINLFQTPGPSHHIFTIFDSCHLNATDALDQQRLAKTWATLSQAEKYSTKMQEVPFRLYQDVCLDLDIIRTDGKDVREFASKLNISVSECARLQQAAKIQDTTTTSVILGKNYGITVEDFVSIMKEMGRQDIVNLINDYC